MNLFKKSLIPPHEAPIDRDARDRMAEALEAYLSRQTDNFELDEALMDIAGESADPTIDFVADEVWYCYDDVKRHKVRLTKEGWDFFYRLILLLRSGGQVEITVTRHGSISQGIAAAALAVFIFLVWWGGFDGFLLAYPLGVVLFVLLSWRTFREPEVNTKVMAMEPFGSMTELMRARRTVRSFEKKRYPDHMKGAGIRSPLLEWLYLPLWALFALQASPLLLPWFLFPDRHTKTRVVFPQQ